MGTQEPSSPGGEPAETAAAGHGDRLNDADGTSDAVTDRYPLPDAVMAPHVRRSSHIYRAANAGAGPRGSAIRASVSSADVTSSVWARGVQIAAPAAEPKAEPVVGSYPGK